MAFIVITPKESGGWQRYGRPKRGFTDASTYGYRMLVSRDFRIGFLWKNRLSGLWDWAGKKLGEAEYREIGKQLGLNVKSLERHVTMATRAQPVAHLKEPTLPRLRSEAAGERRT